MLLEDTGMVIGKVLREILIKPYTSALSGDVADTRVYKNLSHSRSGHLEHDISDTMERVWALDCSLGSSE